MTSMKRGLRTYTGYSIATGVVWVVILIVVRLIDPSSTLEVFWLVSLGFFLGWLSATIARAVYPPRRKHRTAA